MKGLSTHRSGARYRRSGSNTVEFALLLPVFIAILAAAFEYSWFFFVRTTAVDAVRSGCRAGSVVPTEAAVSPSDAASSSIKSTMSGAGFFGIDCYSTEESRCEVTVEQEGEYPTQTLSCTLMLEYPGMTGLVPTPPKVEVRAIELLEIQ